MDSKDLSSPISYLSSEFEVKVISGIKELLEQKHLYQNLTIQIEDLSNEVGDFPLKRSPGPEKMRDIAIHADLKKSFNKIITESWCFVTETGPRAIDPAPNIKWYTLPTIEIICHFCKGHRRPHNSGYKGQSKLFSGVTHYYQNGNSESFNQTFFFPYQCQSCKKEPVIFMVRRTGLKLQLVGRNHIEYIDIPKFIPREESKYYSDAIVAYNAGKVLAGLFYLRTFIEQYMRRITNNSDIKMTGEELGDAYAKLLADDFPTELHKSLKKVYEELSVPLHNAEDNTEQFEISKKDILDHCDQLRLIPLKSPNTNEDL